MPTPEEFLGHPSDCGCCRGVESQIPQKISNPDGLDRFNYRIGRYGDFRSSLLARISSFPFLASHLRTRTNDDFSIALLDSWSIVADVLTFYSEYFSHQSYLRTADERLSVRELARLIGYRPHPGVAATTMLAFSLDELPGSPEQIMIDIGTKVQSTPGPDETAQIFETIEKREARRTWQNIRPRLTKPQVLTKKTKGIVLRGLLSQIQPGAGILYTTQQEDSVFAVVSEAKQDALAGVTRLTVTPLNTAPKTESPWQPPPFENPVSDWVQEYEGTTMSGEDLDAEAQSKRFQVQELFDTLSSNPKPEETVIVFSQKAAIFGHNAPDWDSLPEALKGETPVFGTGVFESIIIEKTNEGPYVNDMEVWPGSKGGTLHILNRDECPDGGFFLSHSNIDLEIFDNEPEGGSSGGGSSPATEFFPGSFDPSGGLPNNTAPTGFAPDVPDPPEVHFPEGNQSFTAQSSLVRIFLDQEYKQIQVGEFVVLRSGQKWGMYRINEVTDLTKSCFTITAKVTRLLVDRGDDFKEFPIRTTSAYVQSEVFELAPLAEEAPVLPRELKLGIFIAGESNALSPSKHTTLELDTWVGGLQVGQQVVLSGQEVGGSDAIHSEILMIKDVQHDLRRNGRTMLTFSSLPSRSYIRSTVSLNANLVLATHGETVQEILGNGDATRPYQTFTLRQPPITHVPASNARGAESSLEIRVNNIRWHETPFFLRKSPTDRLFVTRTTDEGDTVVNFGNGVTGSRLSSGSNNIRATYRRGLGTEGNLRAGQLTMLMTRPLGLKEVTNPLPATGGDNPESRDDTQVNAPMTVLTMDRNVSLRDYEDFARGVRGVAKALATWVWNGRQRLIVVTVAGPDGAAIDQKSLQYEQLVNALHQAGDPFVKCLVRTYRPAFFRFGGKVKIHPDYLVDLVFKEVEEALRASFSFSSREFGQPVALSKVVQVIQRVPGVIAVDVDTFHRHPATSRLKTFTRNVRPFVEQPAKSLSKTLTLNARFVAEQPKKSLFKIFTPNDRLLVEGTHLDSNGTLLGAELMTLHSGPLSHLGELA